MLAVHPSGVISQHDGSDGLQGGDFRHFLYEVLVLRLKHTRTLVEVLRSVRKGTPLCAVHSLFKLIAHAFQVRVLLTEQPNFSPRVQNGSPVHRGTLPCAA